MSTESKLPLVPEENPDVVEAELNRILGVRKFASAPQMSAFLKYIVRQTLIGKADRIKAYSVGVDALGKPDTFDAQTDPSVRVLALRLRKTLNALYENPADSLAIIELKVGTYVPKFYKPSGSDSDESYAAATCDESQTGSGATLMPSLMPARNQVGEMFTVNDDVAERPLRDPETTVAHSVESVPTSNPSQNSARGNALKRNFQSSVNDIRVQLPTLYSCFFAASLTLLAAAWQISIAEPENGRVSLASLSLLPAINNFNVSSGKNNAAKFVAVPAAPTVPTVYFDLSESVGNLERQLILTLSSSVVQSGTVSMVRHEDPATSNARPFWPGEYQLVVSGFLVEGNMRVDAQLVSLSSGEMLYADTLTIEGFEQPLSSRDLLAIESMAAGIVNPEGPVYSDFCNSNVSVRQVDCAPS